MPPKENDVENVAHQGTPLLNGSSNLQLLGTVQTTTLDLQRSRRLLYLSHFFNQFSENSWQFCLVLFLAAFSNYQSLILVSSYGLLSTACVCYFGSTTGRFIDGTNRLVVAQRFIGYENCAVLLATACCYLLLSTPHDQEDVADGRTLSSRLRGVPTDLRSLLLLACVHVLGATAKILDSGFLVAVERDWIVVMSTCIQYHDENKSERLAQQKTWLSDTNVTMKQIDLGCQVVAPAIAGIFVAIFDDGTSQNRGSNLVGAAVFVGLLNAMALVVEYICTAKIYHDIPALARKRDSSALKIDTNSDVQVDCHDHISLFPKRKKLCFIPLPEGLKAYMDQDVSWAGIGLSLL